MAEVVVDLDQATDGMVVRRCRIKTPSNFEVDRDAYLSPRGVKALDKNPCRAIPAHETHFVTAKSTQDQLTHALTKGVMAIVDCRK